MIVAKAAFCGPPSDAGLPYHQEWAILCETDFQRKAGLRYGEGSQGVPILTVPHFDSSLQIYSDCQMQVREGRQMLDTRLLDGA